MSARTFIYGLVEPDTGKLRYVGKTNNPDKRYQRHLREQVPSRKKNWITGLRMRGLLPVMELFFEVPISEWQRWEKTAIALFRSAGCDLVNQTDGGDGNSNFSAEVRERIGAGNRGIKKHSEEWKAALSERMQGNKYAEGTVISDERKLEIARKHQGNKHALGYKHSLESQEKMRAARFRFLSLRHSAKLFV